MQIFLVPGNGQTVLGMPDIEILEVLTTATQETHKHKVSTITVRKKMNDDTQTMHRKQARLIRQ